jgi:hypothetical protein
MLAIYFIIQIRTSTLISYNYTYYLFVGQPEHIPQKLIGFFHCGKAWSGGK